MSSLGVYVINLQSRADRLASITENLHEIGISFERINASRASDVQSRYLSSGVFAILDSHLLALKTFLKSSHTYALILEDDARLSQSFDLERQISAMGDQIDFLQIGFLQNNATDFFEVSYFNFRRRLITTFDSFIRRFFPKKIDFFKLNERLVVREHIALPRDWIASNVQAGAHAYIVNRNFASEILNLSTQPFLAIDDFYMALGRMRCFKMYRLRKSKCRQVDMGSDVESRFKIYS